MVEVDSLLGAVLAVEVQLGVGKTLDSGEVPLTTSPLGLLVNLHLRMGFMQ